MKKCSTCKIEKEFEFFSRLKSSKDGYKYSCKDCIKKYSIINKDKIKEYKKEYYLNNKECIDSKNKKYYIDNKDKIQEYQSIYWSDQINKERRKSNYKRWREDNKENIKEYKKRYYHNVVMTDDMKRFKYSVRSMVKRFIENKSNNTEYIIGCSYEFLKSYIESKFEIWMSWDNYGLYNGELNYGWDIDHIIPLSSANTEEDVIILNHYTNLQPLCSKINRDIKKDNINFNI